MTLHRGEGFGAVLHVNKLNEGRGYQFLFPASKRTSKSTVDLLKTTIASDDTHEIWGKIKEILKMVRRDVRVHGVKVSI
jgi:hypothetical protein